MSTRERASSLFNILTEEDLKLFISIFERLYIIPHKTVSSDMEERRKAFESILAERPKSTPDFDDKQELLDYLDERYGENL